MHGMNGRVLLAALMAVMVPLTIAGCQRGGAVTDPVANSIADANDVRAALQAYFDKHLQCAPLLSTDATSGDLIAQPQDPAARALSEAGLIERVRGEAEMAGGERVVRYRPAQRYLPSFTKAKWGTSDGWLLCYARRQIKDIAVTNTNAGPRVAYRFQLVDASDWMRHPAIISTFPQIVKSLSGEFGGEEPVAIQNGKPDLDDLQPTFEHSLVTRGAAFLKR